MTDRIEKVLDLGTPDSGCGDIRVTYEGLSLLVEYEYRLGTDLVGRIRFVEVIAFRFCDEMHSAGFATESYDAVVEVHSSAWLQQLQETEPSGIGGLKNKKHYAVLLSSNGYIEVVAGGVVAESPGMGFLGVSNGCA